MDDHAQANHFRQMYPVLKAALASHSQRLTCLRLLCPLEISQDVFSCQFPYLKELELRIDGIKSLLGQTTLIRDVVVPFLLRLRPNLSTLILDIASDESFPQSTLFHHVMANLEHYPKLIMFSLSVSESELRNDSGLNDFFSLHAQNLSSFSFHISSSPDFRWGGGHSEQSPLSIFNHSLPTLTSLSLEIPARCLPRLHFPCSTPSPQPPTSFGYQTYVASHLRKLVELSLHGYFLTPEDFSSIFSTPSAAPFLRKSSLCLLHFESSIAMMLEKASPQLQKLSLTFLSFIYFPTTRVSYFFH